MTIYVANLNTETIEDDLITLFSRFGKLVSVKIIKDQYSGESKRFGFIEMEDDSAARKAIDSLHDTDFMNKKIVVNTAKPRTNGNAQSGNKRPYNNFSGNKNYNY